MLGTQWELDEITLGTAQKKLSNMPPPQAWGVW